MCGIAGVVTRSPATLQRFRLDALTRSLVHRGPDGQGIWRSQENTVALVHTRLAIVDLTPNGAQPMASSDGRYRIVFNGEIYNDRDLRHRLETRGRTFRTRSDTEVLLHLYDERREQMLEELDGMFAFGIYDTRDRTLFCARDRLGEKPLYVTQSLEHFAFASEVRALVSAGIASDRVDPRGIAMLLRQGSIPPPFTHLADVELMDPGSWLRVDGGTLERSGRRWWRLPFAPDPAREEPLADALDRIHASMRVSVTRRLRADVPVGAFLSGGLDSAVICAMMKEAGAADLQTFTVTLPNQPGDESLAARSIAHALGTRHTEIPLELADDGQWLDDALAAMDVPSNDGPNTWLVARAVRQAGLKVACSGVGGDELFFGYPTFKLVPLAARLAVAARPLARVRALGRAVARRIPAPPRLGRTLDAVLAGGDLAAVWLAKRSLYSERECAELLGEAYRHAASDDPVTRIEALPHATGLAPEREVSFMELSVYMHDQLLRDSDAMSMAHGLELRLPLIGLPVVEAVAQTHTSILIGDRPKAVLRAIAARYLPPGMVGPTKRGFALNWRRILERRGLRWSRSLPLLRAGAADAEMQRMLRGSAPCRLLTLEALGRSFEHMKTLNKTTSDEDASGRAAPAPL